MVSNQGLEPDQPFVERVARDDAVGVDRWDPGDDHRPVRAADHLHVSRRSGHWKNGKLRIITALINCCHRALTISNQCWDASYVELIHYHQPKPLGGTSGIPVSQCQHGSIAMRYKKKICRISSTSCSLNLRGKKISIVVKYFSASAGKKSHNSGNCGSTLLGGSK